LTTEFYEPIQKDLNIVEEKLSSLGKKASADAFETLGELLEDVLEVPGKRTRPAITLLASKFYPYTHDHPHIMATAVELLHIATLIHDDTVDNSDVRRGKATISSTWGKDIALLLGDYVFATSATFVCDTNNVRVIKRFSETIMELSSGELAEILDAFKWDLGRNPYWRRIYHKTASLFCTSAESGAILSGAPETDVQALRNYGYNVGMAFQIIDDILDFSGTEEEFGKPVGNDLVQGTLTLPSILLLEQYPNNNPIIKLFQDGNSNLNLQKSIEMINNSSIIQESYGVAKDFCDKAIASINHLPKSEYKNSLITLADFIMERRK
jgi:geranylgeranyl pyrophosphate synthase